MAGPTSIDYTSKDYASLRESMLELARYRLPEWTDHSASDLGVLMVDLFAHMGDVLLYYQDRIAAESFLGTASELRSVIELLRLIGYELTPPAASSVALQLTFKAPAAGADPVVTIPTGAQFTTEKLSEPQTFEYLGPPLAIDRLGSRVVAAGKDQVRYPALPVRHGRRMPVTFVGNATGEPNQRMELPGQPVLPESVEVFVETGGVRRRWTQRETLLYVADDEGGTRISGPDDEDFVLERDASGATWLVFGDGSYGKRPAGAVHASYRVGGGPEGNVPAGSITKAVAPVEGLVTVTNAEPAAGGAAAEDIDHAARFGPQAFRSRDRAVTLDDYVTLARKVPGVAKVHALARGWNRVDLYVAPEGNQLVATTPELRREIVDYFRPRRMIGTEVYVLDAVPVPIDVLVRVIPEHTHDPEDVRTRALAAVAALLAFDRVEFGRDLYVSKIYEAVESVDGVFAAAVRRFRRGDRPRVRAFRERRVLGMRVDTGLDDTHLRLLEGEIPPDGRIAIDGPELAIARDVGIEIAEAPE